MRCIAEKSFEVETLQDKCTRYIVEKNVNYSYKKLLVLADV